jgi:ParB family chromosome partitioning protein
MSKNRGLGQGVGLLFGEEDVEKFFHCDIDNILPNKYQPRSDFKEDALDELAESIRENGIIQPLIITKGEGQGRYALVAGERRLRASKIAGLTQVPVVMMDIDNEDSLLELALIENIQRTDLTPIEEAEAYRKLIEKFGYTQEQTAKKVGKNRTTITNLLRLLKLPRKVQKDITMGLLSEGHGRALVKLIDDPLKMQEIRDTIVAKGLSVRQTEKLIRKTVSTKPPINKSSANHASAEIPISYTRALTTQLTNKLNSRVSIAQNGSRGKIEIDYYSADDLDRLSSLLLNE